jgi:predicted DNA-binding protein with PD1-like motif
MGVITGGDLIHPALTSIAREYEITAATFEMLGGLKEIEFRAFDFESQKRGPPTIISHPMEIVSGHGTISLLDELPHVHTHFTVAFSDLNSPQGIAVVGGHVTRAAAHAVEFTLTAFDGVPVYRSHDPETGLMLWDFPPVPSSP